MSLKKVGFEFQACFVVFRGLRSTKFRWLTLGFQLDLKMINTGCPKKRGISEVSLRYLKASDQKGLEV